MRSLAVVVKCREFVRIVTETIVSEKGTGWCGGASLLKPWLTQDSVEWVKIDTREAEVAGRGLGGEAHLRDKLKARSSHHRDRMPSQIGLHETVLGLRIETASRHACRRPSEVSSMFACTYAPHI